MRFAVPVILAVVFAPGCDSSDEAPRPSYAKTFPPQTKGSAVELMDHVERLAKRFTETEAPNPASARDLLLTYTTAVIETATAALNDRTAEAAVREQAAGTILTAISRRSQADPKAFETLVSTSERIEAENPKSGVAAIAAFERCKALGLQFQNTPAPDRPQKIQALANAAEHLGRMESPPSIAPDLLNKTAMDAEAYRRPDVAEQLYKTLVERFPDNDRSPFAQGALARIKLVGQVIDDLRGPGTGGTTTSLKDYRGKVVLIDFWASFCNPCLREIETLEQYRKTMEAKGFLILGICVDPKLSNAEDVIKDAKLTWPQLYSSVADEKMVSVMTTRFGVQRLPFKMVIDRDGKFVASGHYFEDVKAKLDELLPPEKAAKAASTDKK